MKLYYWRRVKETLFLVFSNKQNRNGISAYIMPVEGMWLYHIEMPFRVIEHYEETPEEAQAKAEQLINREFQPEFIPYFG